MYRNLETIVHELQDEIKLLRRDGNRCALEIQKDFENKNKEFNERLQKLENHIQDVLLDFEKRIVELEKYIKAKEIIEKTTPGPKTFVEAFYILELEKLKERLEKLEEFRGRQLNLGLNDRIDLTQELLNNLAVRVKELERFQEITHLQYQKVIKAKVPHKCPMCEGNTYTESKYNPEKIACQCRVCEGKGIVWG